MTKRRRKDKAEIARNMSAIHSTGNRTETALRKTLHAAGFRYRKYSPHVVGKPDIVFPRERIAVFVDGDYWHGRRLAEEGLEALALYYTPKQRRYWIPKLQRNIARDDAVTSALQRDGWYVIRLWESDVKRDVERASTQVARVVDRRRKGLARFSHA